MTVHLLWNGAILHLFVECLESLPNLDVLEIGWTDEFIATPLKDALRGAKLPQIKTLILPPAAHPLLRHCRNVEDVVCLVGCKITSFDRFLGSLAFNRDSKVKRLAIPLVLWTNPFSKRLSTLWGYEAKIIADCLQSLDSQPRVQGSPNSPSPTLIHLTLFKPQEWGLYPARLGVHALRCCSW